MRMNLRIDDMILFITGEEEWNDGQLSSLSFPNSRYSTLFALFALFLLFALHINDALHISLYRYLDTCLHISVLREDAAESGLQPSTLLFLSLPASRVSTSPPRINF